jgi:hypothetical protein
VTRDVIDVELIAEVLKATRPEREEPGAWDAISEMESLKAIDASAHLGDLNGRRAQWETDVRAFADLVAVGKEPSEWAEARAEFLALVGLEPTEAPS